MSIATGNYKFKCNKCGTVHSYKGDQADFILDYGSDSSMGGESGYKWEANPICNKCGNDIQIKYTVVECPPTCYSDQSSEIKGAEEIETFDFDFADPDHD